MGEKRSASDLDELQATKKAYREPSATSVTSEVVILNNNNNNNDGYEDSAIKGLLDMAAGGESDLKSGEPTVSNFSKIPSQQHFSMVLLSISLNFPIPIHGINLHGTTRSFLSKVINLALMRVQKNSKRKLKV